MNPPDRGAATNRPPTSRSSAGSTTGVSSVEEIMPPNDYCRVARHGTCTLGDTFCCNEAWQILLTIFIHLVWLPHS